MKSLRLACIIAGIVSAPAATAQPSTPAPPIGADSAGMFFISYPKLALERNEQGVVGYRVSVDLEGRASDCSVTASSGSERLDRLSCVAALEHTRFAPTRDESGMRTRSLYEGRVVWRIR